MKYQFNVPPAIFKTKTGKKVVVGYVNPVIRGKNYNAEKSAKQTGQGDQPSGDKQ